MTRYTPEYVADRMEIEDLLIRYCTAIDRHDWDLMDTVLLPDGVWDSTAVGGSRGTWRELRAQTAVELAPFVMFHALSNVVVELEGDRATATSYVSAPISTTSDDGSASLFFIGAWYQDQLTRTPDGWRIAERIEEGRWVSGDLPQAVVDAAAGQA